MKNVRKLTEGAILLAAVAALLMISIYVPIIGPILGLATPLPFLLFSARNNLRYIMAFFLAAMFISFIVTSFMGLALMLIYGTGGVVIGYLLQKNKSRTFILIASSLTFMAGMLIFYGISAAFLHMNIIHELTDAVNDSVKNSEEMLRSTGQEDKIKPLKEQSESMIKMVVALAPSAFILASIFASFVTQWICFPIAKRFGISVQPWGRFRNMSLPKSLLWYYLAALGAMLLIHPQEGTYLYAVLINARYIIESFVVLQGMAFLFFILHQKSMAKGLGVLVVILTFMIPIVRYIIMLLGITDLGFDFRKNFGKKE